MTTLQDIKELVKNIKTDCYFEGWDGENAKPTTEAALRMAERYAISHLDKGFSSVDLSPLSKGGIDVELLEVIAGKEVAILIEVSPEGTINGVFARIRDQG